MERAKISDQEKLTLCERTNEELSAEKAHLEQLLKKAEEHQDIIARRFLLRACAVFWRSKCIEKIKPDKKSLYTVQKLTATT